MKKIVNSVVALMVCAVCLFSCKEDEELVTTLSIDKSEITMNADGGVELVTVSGNVNWQTSTDASWVKLTPSAGSGPGICEVSVDSSVIAGFRETEIRFYSSNNAYKTIKVVQAGYEKGIYIENADQEIVLENSADADKRFLEVTMTANVNFTVNVESSGWLTYKDEVPDYDYGDRPRTFKQRFNWTINTSESERTAKIVITPDEGEVITLNVRQKSAPKITDNRAGDSLAVLAIYDSMKGMLAWDASENMMYWDGVELWEATDQEVIDNPDLLGRLKSVRFRLFDTNETLPYQVKYLRTARSIYFSGNTNTFLKSIKLDGEFVDSLAKHGNLKELTISAYGLVELPSNFKDLGKTLECLDLSSNNLKNGQLDVITKENFPKLKRLRISKINRYDTTKDLTKVTEKDSVGFRWCTGYVDYQLPGAIDKTYFMKLLKWDALEELFLSLNLLEGRLPSDKELLEAGFPKYTEDDFNKDLAETEEAKKFIDTISTAKPYLLGAPKIWPKMKALSINLCFLTGELPDWILYHPYLGYWNPFSLIFAQEIDAINSNGDKAGFSNEPTNLSNYESIGKEKSYYDYYPKMKPTIGGDEEE